MTLTDTIPSLPDVALLSAPEPDPVAPSVAVTDTTELRWFSEGRLPSEVTSWFTRAGATGLAEERCDTYRIDGRRDTGVKRRSRETLELKVRRSFGDRLVLDDGLAGRLEVWRRWSPAECKATASRDTRWTDVHKMVIKRRFSVDGDEIVLSDDTRAMTGAGCDVEIASVTIDDHESWSFAFAAFGPTDTREAAIVSAWDALVSHTPCPDQFWPFFGPSSGYPEWLALVSSRSGAVTTCDVRWRPSVPTPLAAESA